MKKLQEFLRRLISLRNVIPFLIIVGAFLGTFTPTPFGLGRDQLLLALLAFLAIDALVERLELLTNIEQDVEKLKKSMESQMGIRDFLRYRKDFPRLEHIIASAKREIWVSGFALDAMVTFVGIFQSRLKEGLKLRFLAIDPDGDAIQGASKYSLSRPEDTAGRVRSNLDALSKRLAQAEAGQVQIRVINQRPSLGYFIVDPTDNKGYMTVMSYIYQIQSSDQLPMFLLYKETDAHWYDVYLRDFQALWDDAREWKSSVTST